MPGNKAMRRALQTADAVRVNAPVPLITDSTELITPDLAQEMLKKNKNNRPVNWKKVEEYAALMKAGKWKLHGQGILLDGDGNILTGQTRLWAIVFSSVNVYMRISRGNPPDTAPLIDRGRPQSARDLATRRTEKKHAPTEASLARAISILRGNTKPSTDDIAEIIVQKSEIMSEVLKETYGTKKTKSVLMVIAAVCETYNDVQKAREAAKETSKLADKLDERLRPHSAAECWGKGTAFSIALEQARRLV